MVAHSSSGRSFTSLTFSISAFVFFIDFCRLWIVSEFTSMCLYSSLFQLILYLFHPCFGIFVFLLQFVVLGHTIVTYARFCKCFISVIMVLSLPYPIIGHLHLCLCFANCLPVNTISSTNGQFSRSLKYQVRYFGLRSKLCRRSDGVRIVTFSFTIS